MRLVVIGGSGASTPELADAVRAWPGGDARRPPLEVILQGRSVEKLGLVAGAFQARLSGTSGAVVRPETDLDRALDGADVILMQVRVGGYDARAFDETFSRAFGIPGEETQGPGGFADAIRTIPALTSIWRRIGERAPQALVVNLTNPSGIVTTAMRRTVDVPVVSICDAPVTFTDTIAKSLGRSAASVREAYVGMNHAGFFVDHDLDAMLAALPATNGLDPVDVERLGALPTPYLRFYLHPDRQLAAQLSAGEPRAQALKRLEAEMLGQYAAGVASGDQSRRGAIWYAISIVPLLDALVSGSEATMILGLPNRDSVSWAPADAIVEGPTRIAAGGSFQREPFVALPPAAADILHRHARYEGAAATALAGVEDRREVPARRLALVAALAENPMVPNAEIAERIVDAILTRAPA